MASTTCPYCSNEIPPNEASCPECGALVSPVGVELDSGQPLPGGAASPPLPPSAPGAYGAGQRISQGVEPSEPARAPSFDGAAQPAPPWAAGQAPADGEAGAAPPPGTSPQPQSPGASWPTGSPPQQQAVDGAPAPPLQPPPATGGSFDEYVKRTTEKEPLSLQKIWSGIGVLVGCVLLAMLGYFYVFGFSQCGGCNNQPPEPMEPNSVVTGELTSIRPTRTYQVQFFEPATVTIAVNGNFDNYLELYAGESDVPMATDDDGGPGLNALLTRNLQPGIYYILVRPFSDGTGSYTLSVTTR